MGINLHFHCLTGDVCFPCQYKVHSAFLKILRYTLAIVKFFRTFAISNTVRLVQLVEHQIVVLGVVGSSPTSHPNK